MSDTIQLRRDTVAAWTAANPVLALAEPGLETDTRRLKVGDGKTPWTSLPYASVPPAAGPAFPASPAIADRWHRTDRLIAYVWDGTRWLSEQLFTLAIAAADFSLPIAGSQPSGFRAANPWAGLYDLYVVDLSVSRYVTGASTWTYSVIASSPTSNAAVGVLPAATDMPGGWQSSRSAIGVVVTQDRGELDGSAILNSGSADAYVLFQVTYRLVG